MSRKKYKFSHAIETELIKLDSYLMANHYKKPSRRQITNYVGIYLDWLLENKLEAKEVEYSDYVDFVFHLKSNYSENMVRRIVMSTRHYYKSTGSKTSPAYGVYIRRVKKKVIEGIVPFAELEDLYNNYEVFDDRDKRNRIMIGLMIYQALKTNDLQWLEPGHFNLKQGKLKVPGVGGTNKRILEIKAHQLLDIQEYLLTVRPRMLENIKSHRPGRKVKEIDPIIYDRMFFGANGNVSIKPSLYNLFRMLKRKYPKITSGSVIRNSVITEWTKTMDIRIVQYMAGHKWVGTTERYSNYNLDGLKESLGKYHPLK